MTLATEGHADQGRVPAQQRWRPLVWQVVVGFLLLELAWILVVPPFRASDEFDHAYRAAAVAHGQWIPDGPAGQTGRGTYVSVPLDIVRAARLECARLPYTKHDDCWPAARSADGLVKVSSGAGAYNPVFYAVIGWAATPLEGTQALYAMRAAAVALCGLMFGLAVLVTRVWARGPWPFLALTVACSPVVLFSTSVAAPNGLEIVAGLCFAAALVGMSRLRASTPRRVVAIAAASGAVLVTLRSLGPLWLVLIMLTVGVATSARRQLMHDLWRRRDVRIGGSLVLLATIASFAWVLELKPLGEASTASDLASLREGISLGVASLPGWILQSIAAFPFRTQLAPAVVYVAGGSLFAVVMLMGFRRASGRQRVAMELVIITTLMLPLLLTGLSYASLGEVAWQGRYGLPFAVSMLVVAGLVADEGGAWLSRRYVIALAVVNMLAQAPGPVHVLRAEAATNPQVGAGTWHVPSAGLIWVLAALGAGLCLWGSVGRKRAERLPGLGGQDEIAQADW